MTEKFYKRILAFKLLSSMLVLRSCSENEKNLYLLLLLEGWGRSCRKIFPGDLIFSVAYGLPFLP